MNYERFKEIWTTLVTNRAPKPEGARRLAFTNGVSEHTIDALVAVADGDNSHFEKIQHRLPKRSS